MRSGEEIIRAVLFMCAALTVVTTVGIVLILISGTLTFTLVAALVYLTPARPTILPTIRTFNVLDAGILVALMIVPTIARISEDAMQAVPGTLRQAAYGLGVAKYQVSVTIAAGGLPSMPGSLYVMLVVAVLSLPIGVGTAIFLEEYAGRSPLKTVIEMNIANLAGVPSTGSWALACLSDGSGSLTE
ncbi:MAG: hypothetical protein E4H09_03435 [Spirochaetales bacterium]|nr:MAG: hypothetical protein E4H09_03435 [Spirochaetales bacterium]